VIRSKRRHHRRRSSTELGELALGRTCSSLHAVERLQLRRLDPALERIVQDDVFSSITSRSSSHGARHQARPEEITRDIPNVSEEALKNLDDRHRLHRRRCAGDILCGKITRRESPMTRRRSSCARSSARRPPTTRHLVALVKPSARECPADLQKAAPRSRPGDLLVARSVLGERQFPLDASAPPSRAVR